MTQEKTPIGEIVLVGRVAYQLYSRTFRGVVEFYARIGKPVTSRETGETSIIPHMMDDSWRDYMEAAEKASVQLEELRTTAFRYSVQKSAATVSAVSPQTEDELEEPLELKLA